MTTHPVRFGIETGQQMTPWSGNTYRFMTFAPYFVDEIQAFAEEVARRTRRRPNVASPRGDATAG